MSNEAMSALKKRILVSLLIAAVMIVILSIGMSGLHLQSGQPFSLGQKPPEVIVGGAPQTGGDLFILILRGILALGLILLPAHIILSLLTPEGRRQLVAEAIVLTSFLLLADYLSKLPKRPSPDQEIQSAAPPVTLPPIGNTEPTVTFSATPPGWVTNMVILAISILIVVLIFVGIRVYQARKRNRKPSFEALGEKAQNALDSLRTGGDLKNAILSCYREMTRVINELKGFSRDRAMTSREFEAYLVSKGFPREPIDQLTGLFEEVRYGAKPVGSAEEQQAIQCLSDIVTFCKSIGPSRTVDTIGAAHEAS